MYLNVVEYLRHDQGEFVFNTRHVFYYTVQLTIYAFFPLATINFGPPKA